MKFACLLLLSALALLANDEFFEAARKGDTAALKAQLDKGVDVNLKWRYDQTALFMAARGGHLDAVKLLLERGASADAKDSFYSMTALSGAAEKGNVELVKLLVVKGATGVDQVFTMAVGQKNAAMVKGLIDTGKVSAETLSTGMAAASAAGATDMVEMLKAAGAKPLEEPKLDAAVLASYAGSYRDTQNNEMKLEVAGGRLTAAAFGQTIPLRAIDATTFAPLPYPAIRITLKVDGDKVNGLEFKQGNMTQAYTRVEAK
jgi:ankyrin repeat protein